MRRALGILAILAAACGAAPDPAPPPADAPPNLVLILIDTLRADHVGAYGYPRPTSPNLDGLADRGTLFERAFAPSSWTKPSVASLFTSRLPSEHGAFAFDRRPSDTLPTLAELLRDAGYVTLAVSGNFVHVNEASGLERGFEYWKTVSVVLEPTGDDELWAQPDADGAAIRLESPPADLVNRAVLQRVPPAGDAPLFLYVHYMEPHTTYGPDEGRRRAFATDETAHAAGPEATSQYLIDLVSGRARADTAERQRLIDLYDAEIAAVDTALGQLLAALFRRGYDRNTVYVIVSDHGEEFLDHDGWFHGLTLHRESVAIPLVVYDTRTPRARRRSEPVDLLDVPTTLLGLAGITPPAEMHGRDLLADAPLPARSLLAELHPGATFEAHARPREQRVALTHWPFRAIVDRDGTARVYQLDRDPTEQTPLPANDAAIPPELARRVADLAAFLARAPAADEPEALDAETLRKLRALGYAQ